MEIINFKNVIKELLKALRGRRSQEALNRSFGFSFNQVSRWERGVTKIDWPEFVHFCELCHIPLRKKMLEIFKAPLALFVEENQDPLISQNVVHALMGNLAIDKFSKRYQLPRKSVSKWLSGQAHPSLEQIFFMLHYHSGQLIKLLDCLAGAENIPSLQGVIAKLKIREEITYRYPEVSLILNTIHTKTFKAKTECPEGYFAKKFGLTSAEEKEILGGLLRSDTIHRFGSSFRMNKYDIFRINANADQMSRRYIRYFTLINQVLEKGELRAPYNFFSHLVFPSNLKQVQKLKKTLLDATSDIGMQISDEQDLENFDKLMIMTMALCALD